MNKYEIETAIIEELKNFMPSIKNVPFDKGLPLMQREAWRLADKYDTDGANVINIMMKRFEELKDENQKRSCTCYCECGLFTAKQTSNLQKGWKRYAESVRISKF